MTHFTRTASVTALLCLSATMSQALTADTLWASWQETATRAGLSLTAEAETREGATLRLSGISLSDGGSATGPETAGEAMLDEILLTEAADGSVSIVPSAELDMAMSGPESGPEEGSLTLTQTGMTLTATEAAGGGTSYQIAAESLVVAGETTMASPMSTDASAPQLATQTFDIGFANLAGTVDQVSGSNRSVVVGMTADELRYDIAASDAAMESNSVQTSATQDLALNATFTLPATMMLAALTTPEAWAAAFAEGMALTIKTTQGESVGSVTEENPYMPLDMAVTAQPGITDISVGKDGMAVESTAGGLQVKVQSTMLPFPSLDVGIGPVEVAMSIPLMAGEVAQDFGLRFKLADVTVNDEAWAMIDPGASLPRDPMQLSIDTSGTAKLDLFTLMAADQSGMTEVQPPQPETLNITELSLRAIGAVVSGTGAFTFDNASGTPVPVGEATVSVQGANAVIDKLIALGVLTEQDAGGARMMMAMFMTPVSGPDDLTSKVETKADGSIFVNGQQIQ